MITYYNDRAVQVTSQAIRVAGRNYPLATLSRVWHRRGQRSWGTVAGRGAIGVALIVPLVAAGLGILLALRLHTSMSTTVLIVGCSVLVGLATGPLADFLLGRLDLSYSKGSRALEIWAEVGGRPTLLVRTADALTFGQIYRALQRALEAAPRY